MTQKLYKNFRQVQMPEKVPYMLSAKMLIDYVTKKNLIPVFTKDHKYVP